jgi:hypothetical protein
MKHVFTNSELPHIWVHQGQSDGRGSNMFFSGTVIYSYGSHFPIAEIVNNARGDKAVMFTTDTYGPTTGRHCNEVRRAIPPSVPTFHVDLSPGKDPARYAPELIEALEPSFRAALKAWNAHRSGAAWKIKAAQKQYEQVAAFLAFFDLPAIEHPVPHIASLLEQVDIREAAEQIRKEEIHAAQRAKWLADEPIRAAAAEARRVQQELDRAAREAHLLANVPLWQAGQRVEVPYLPILLRVEGLEVVTSRGARIPINRAKLAIALVRDVVATGIEWKANGRTFKLGMYAIDRIDVDGTVHAGCHVVKLDEIERLAPEVLAAPVEAE